MFTDVCVIRTLTLLPDRADRRKLFTSAINDRFNTGKRIKSIDKDVIDKRRAVSYTEINTIKEE